MRSGRLRPFVPVTLRWVSFRGFGVGSAPAPTVVEGQVEIKRESTAPKVHGIVWRAYAQVLPARHDLGVGVLARCAELPKVWHRRRYYGACAMGACVAFDASNSAGSEARTTSS